MARYLFDIETNGLLDQLNTVHSLCMIDVDSGEEYSFSDSGSIDDYRSIDFGLDMLREADEIIGHNIIKFDIPAIQKVYPWATFSCKVTDTLNDSRLIWTNLFEDDMRFRARKKDFPGQLMGRHSLEAWGQRLGFPKDDYSKRMKEKGLDPWAEWNPMMQEYCEQDARVALKLLKLIESKQYSTEARELEVDFQKIIFLQEQFGFPFDEAGAQRLYATLSKRRAELEDQLRSTFKPWYINQGMKTQGRTVTYRKNRPFPETWEGGTEHCKVKQVEFNPGSRDHIADRLIKLRGWKPKAYGNDGKPTVDDAVISTLHYPEAKLIAEYLMVQKRIGQLAEGNQALLKVVKQDRRIHGEVTTNGAVTGRCTHARPNVAQTPAVGVPFGREFRALYTAPDGWTLVGADASGLELRCLAHFMGNWDGGAYADLILNGDIHTANQQAAGLPTRNNAKTFIYAFLYGAGDEKIGSIIGKGPAAGKKLKRKFRDGLPALDKLLKAVEMKVKKPGYLIGLDGRRLHVRSAHAALNTLLQSAGALVMKKALVILFNRLTAEGLQHGKDYAFVANVHDEFQIAVAPHINPEEIGNAAVESIRAAGDHFGFRCPLDGEFKVGRTWADTH